MGDGARGRTCDNDGTNSEEPAMAWETPEVTEVKMDAEIGSYQVDDEGPLFATDEAAE
jgi:hypothetical protein